MGSTEPDSFEDLQKQFRTEWFDTQQPSIDEYVDKVPSDVRDRLRSRLQKIEDELKTQHTFPSKPGSTSLDGDKPAPDPKAITVTDHGGTLGSDSGSLCFENAKTDDPEPGDEVGRYRLIERIGHGGMGVVWLAEQQIPVQRKVALKLIRQGGGSRHAIARFEAERQAIAMMEHQNIAKILDADTTKNGIPYFVMELVDGVPLDEYCDREKLSVRQRLEIFVPVCNAVQHAHQKGIIHRDLKHSNILVTEFDGKPVAKIIDFGLAKALRVEGNHTDQTAFTEAGRVVGTLQYMSPEQAISSNVDVDTRSDIYSLGIVLYKLLTGSTPLELELKKGMSILEILEFIKQKDPAVPSSRLSGIAQAIQVVAEDRNSSPEKLPSLLKGDLDSIVMKALEKERSKRYQTANGLAKDIERHLNDVTVLARPQSKLYTAQKFVKRNKGLVASLSAITILLIGGIVATSLSLIWARAEMNRALAAEKVAESNLHAGRIKSAWSDWQLGNYQSARMTLAKIPLEKEGWESRFLEAEFDKSLATLYGHASEITGLAASADGKWIATSGTDNVVKIWDKKKHKLVRTHVLNGHSFDVCFSDDSKFVAMADGSEQIAIRETATGKLHKLIKLSRAGTGRIDMSPDGNAVLATFWPGDIPQKANMVTKSNVADNGGYDVGVYSVQSGEPISSFEAHRSDIKSAKFLDNETIATCSLDQTIRVWKREKDDFELVRTFAGCSAGVTDAELSPDGKMLVGSSLDHSIRIWDFDSGLLVATRVEHDNAVWSIDISPEGDRIVSASADKDVIVWSISGEPILKIQGHFGWVDEAIFSADGTEVISASDDHTARIWDAGGGSNVRTVNLSDSLSDIVWTGDYSSDGKLIVTASEDGNVAFVDPHTGKIVGKRLKHDCAVLVARFFGDDSRVLCSAADGNLYLWNVAARKLEKTIHAHKGIVWGLKFSPDGKQFATASEDRMVKIWDTSTFSIVKELDEHRMEVGSIEFSPDGKFLATAGDDLRILLWDRKDYRLVHTFSGHRNPVWRAIFSPDSRLLASSSYDGEIRLWDLETRTLLHRFTNNTDQVAGLTFTPDGSRLVSASDDESIRVYDLESKTEIFVLRDESDSEVVHVSFSPDGTQLISGSIGDLTIRSVNAHTGQPELLPQQIDEQATEGTRLIRFELSTMKRKELTDLAETAQRWCDFFPTIETLTILGVTKYQLGESDSAFEALQEAYRLTRVQMTRPDVDTSVECYLILCHLDKGDVERATELREEFDQLNEQKLSLGDPRTIELDKLVSDAFATQ